jgi:hypothetical protein
MNPKIFLKYIILSVYTTINFAAASLAIQVERFIHRPILHNFIQAMHCENRWQSWTLNTLQPQKSDVIPATSTLHMRPTAATKNFILPGFGLQLDSFFLHDSIGTERCEDAIRAETTHLNGVRTTYLSVAYCLGSKDKSFILGTNRTSIVHIYSYVNNVLSCTYTALCPVRADFGCHLNGHGGEHGREKEITKNNKVAQSPDFDEEHYSLDFIKEYSRQAAHIMIDTKGDASHHVTVPHTASQHATAHEGHFYHYDIAFHMASLAAGRNGLSERLYQRGIAALLASQTTTDAKSDASERTSDGYTSAEESDASTFSHRGRSTKECAGQIMRVCAFSTDFLITSWHKRDITSVLEQCGIDTANGRCIIDEKWREFSLIKSLHADFTGVIPYFFDNAQLYEAVYERQLNYSALLRSLTSRKRNVIEANTQLIQTTLRNVEERATSDTKKQSKKRKLKLMA